MILTQHPVVIDLSRPAMQIIVELTGDGRRYSWSWRGQASKDVETEIDNFTNLLQNLLERSEPENLETVKPENLDLVGG